MKAWRSDFDKHVKHWSSRLDKAGRGWWPRYIYHFTDVQNAVSALNEGILYSRHLCVTKKRMCHDNANLSIIASTREEHLKLVRLYFRPLTPTQYVNEGIKLSGVDDGHCPVPVFFFFRFSDLLARDDTFFSKDTMAGSALGYSERREYFREIDFDDVYSVGGWGAPDSEKARRLRRARHAEVLVPEYLRLGDELRWICCRSTAERETLLNGLEDHTRSKWGRAIRTGVDNLYYRHRPHIQSVRATSPRTFEIELYRPSINTLSVELNFVPDDGTAVRSHVGTIQAGGQIQQYRLPRAYDGGLLEYRIGGCLAFRAPLRLTDQPV